MTITAHSRSESEETSRELIQEGDVAMPFYIVVDKSLSMRELQDALNDGLQSLQQLIIDHPEIADIVRVSIIAFDNEARVLVPLGTLETATIPTIVAGGGTNYSAAFRTLREAIDSDVAQMKAQGHKTFRPCAFFLSDGEPNPSDRDWVGEFERQFGYDPESGAGNKMYPRVIPFGFGDAEMSTMAKLAYPPKGGVAFVQKAGTTIEDAFTAILPMVGRTILASGRTVIPGGGQPAGHQVTPTVPGFEPVPSQYAGGDWL